MSNANHPLQPVCQTWLRCIEAAKAAKARRFDRDAAECMRFYTGPYDFLWDQFETDKHVRVQGGEADSGQWRTRVSTNKVAEFVQIFGPSLYARNPTRRVTPRRPPDLPPDLYAMMGPEAQFLFQQSMAQTTKQVAIDAGRAALLECYLNQTPNALDLRFNMRQAIDEALIKGMGVLWPEKYKVPGAEFHMVGSFYGSIDELQIDPDAKCLNDAKWVARRCVQPTWEVEAKFGLPPGSLCERGHMESSSQAAALTEAEQSLGLQGRGGDGSSNDLMVYWKIWSKMGCGGRLAKVAPGLRQALEIFPVHSYLCIAPGVPYPLNVPPDIGASSSGAPVAAQRMQWPTPYWADGGWPFVPISFHMVPNEVWPLAHLAAAMGELKFLNWAFGHIAAKIRATTRDFVVVVKEAANELKSKILHGNDMELLEIAGHHGKTIDQVVQWLRHPEFNGDLWRVMDAVMQEFEKRTGLSELMYGEAGKQMRSGTEAQLRGDQLNIRPDDMAECVEAASSTAARREALAARWHLTSNDVRPVIGQIGAMWWENLVYASDARDLLFNLEYRVEAGSSKKPNKSRDQEQANAMMNNLFSPLYSYASATGDMRPINTIMRFWGKAQDIDDVETLMLRPPPPPQSQQAAQPAEQQQSSQSQTQPAQPS